MKNGWIIYFAFILFVFAGCTNALSALKVQKSDRLDAPYANLDIVEISLNNLDAQDTVLALEVVSKQKPKHEPAVAETAGRKINPLRTVEEIIPERLDTKKSQKFPEKFAQTIGASYTEEPAVDEPKTVNASIIGFVALCIALLNILVLMYVPFLGLAFGLLALVFAFKALKIDNKKSRTLAAITMVLTMFTLLISTLATLLLIAGVNVFG